MANCGASSRARKQLPITSLSRVPRRAQSVSIVHAILDATLIVLREDDGEANVSRIAQVAGVSPGTIYQYFASKEMLVNGVTERMTILFEDMVQEVAFHADSIGPGARSRMVHRALAFAMARRATVLAAMRSMSPEQWEAFIGALCRTMDTTIRRYQQMHQDKYRVTSTASDIHVAVNGMVFGVIQWLVHQPVHISAETLTDALVRTLSGLGEWEVVEEPTPALSAQAN